MTEHDMVTGATSIFLQSSASLFFISYNPELETSFSSSASFTLLFCTPPISTATPTRTSTATATATPTETPTLTATGAPTPTGFPGEIGTICPVAPTVPASNVGPAPDLAILVPTLRLLPTITATVQISAEIVSGPIALAAWSIFILLVWIPMRTSHPSAPPAPIHQQQHQQRPGSPQSSSTPN